MIKAIKKQRSILALHLSDTDPIFINYRLQAYIRAKLGIGQLPLNKGKEILKDSDKVIREKLSVNWQRKQLIMEKSKIAKQNNRLHQSKKID